MDRCLIYRHGVRTGDKVALTFDDGPNPPRTEQILAILADAGVRATFFVGGKWAERFPESVRRMVAGGHLIGNHGHSLRLRVGDYDEAEAVIGHLTGVPSRYFRAHGFDYGAYFQSGVSRLPESRVIDADVNPADWTVTAAEEIVRRVLEHPDLGPGSIINLHDGSESDDASVRLSRPLPTIAALPRIVARLHARGLRCARVDELELAEPIEWTATRTAAPPGHAPSL
ncbi:MAG: polysaccharide deacetylase family protein [Chloroflexi bacterium]|nr:polysaccharide deacetylase family protein [Chloroflexota bacterium]